MNVRFISLVSVSLCLLQCVRRCRQTHFEAISAATLSALPFVVSAYPAASIVWQDADHIVQVAAY